MADANTTKAELFQLGARYEISHDADWKGLAEDANSFLTSALGMVSSLAQEFGENRQSMTRHDVAHTLYSALYLLEMGKNAAYESYERAWKQEREAAA